MDQEKKKRLKKFLANVKIIGKKMGETGSKMGKSLEKYDTSKNKKTGQKTPQKEFDMDELLKKLPQ